MNELNKDRLSAIIPFSEKDNDWIAANDDKLRKEKDVIDFLNYYNNRKQAAL